jgi:hypothetical protein
MITEEEKERRRKEYITELNMFLSDCDDEYIEYRLSHKTEADFAYEKWINGEITYEELLLELHGCLDTLYPA